MKNILKTDLIEHVGNEELLFKSFNMKKINICSKGGKKIGENSEVQDLGFHEGTGGIKNLKFVPRHYYIIFALFSLYKQSNKNVDVQF